KDINSITTENKGILTINAGDNKQYTFGDTDLVDTSVITNKDLADKGYVTSADDKTAKVAVSGKGLKVTDDSATNKNQPTYTLSLVEDDIKDIAGTAKLADDLTKKADKNAGNLETGDITAWKTKLGVSNIDTTINEFKNTGMFKVSDGKNKTDIKVNDTITFAASNDNLTVLNNAGTITYGLSKNLKDINSITTENKGILTINAGDNKQYTFGDTDLVDTSVITNKDLKEAVKQINTQVGSVNLNIAGDHGTKGSVKLSSGALSINGDGKNITTSVKNGEVKVALNDEINLGNVGENKINLGKDGLKITQADGSKGPSITADGIAMNGKQITGLKSGLDGLGQNGKDGTIADYKNLNDAEKEKYKHNAATIGDLATVDGKIVNVSTNINNIIGDKYIKHDGNGNKTINVDKIKEDLATNAASGQKLVVADGKGAIDTIVNSIKNINTQGTRFFHVNDGYQVKGTGKDKHDSSAGSKGGVAIGIQAKVGDNAKNAISIGTESQVSVAGGVALGSYSQANRKALDDTTKKDVYLFDNKAVADTVANTKGAISVGSEVGNKFTRQITGVAAGTQDSDAVNVAQLRAVQKIANQGSKWIAANTQKFDKNGKIVDNDAKAEANGINSVAIGAGSNTEVVSNGKIVDRPNTVSVGGRNADGTVTQRTISNVAPGVLDSDAATMGQLRAGLNDVYGKLGEYKKDASAGTASALAVGNLPQATIPGKGMVSLGSGFYDGQSAMAIGLSKMSDSGKWVFKGSASYDSQEKAGAALSVGFHF
ncbi:YadA family autotransporter adhesin, partial [Campylobacter ureolyticus]|uniref:YadA family autotransporter adhesin n=1 Tax=Campylobacter ureolyticus TaxID=827 RepID=UPI0022B3A48D